MIRMIIKNANRLAPTTITAAILLLHCGCQFAPTKKVWPIKWFAKEDKPAVPDRMMIVWTDTILHQPQKPGVRGFGGRVFFYSGNETNPVKVDGSLTIYAYDNDNLDSDATRPERKFVFTGEQFEKHMSYTDLGPSYSIWLPWDEVGGEGRQLSLVSRFDGSAGGVVISKPAVKLLPGLAKKQKRGGNTIAKSSDTGVRQAGAELDPSDDHVSTVGYDGDGDNPSQAATRLQRPKPPRVSPMMIDLPPNFHRHLIDERRDQSGPTVDRKPEPTSIDKAAPPATPAADSSPDLPPTATPVTAKNAVTNPRFSRSMKAFRNYANGSESFQEPPTQTLNRPAGWLEPIERSER